MLAALLLAIAQQDKTTWQFESPDPGWRKVTYSGQADFRVTAGGNGQSLTISSTNGADASWSVDAPVKPNTIYKLSGRVRTESVSGAIGALLNVHQLAGATTRAVTGNMDWTNVEVVFRSGNRSTVQINALFGGWGQSKGRADYDDITLERIDMSDFPGPVTIDVMQTREPISKYIYGQFIEHLGKCIYGGIWAEMLEDRKFYYPIEGKPAYQHMREGYDRLVASPWRALPGATSLVSSDFRTQKVLRLTASMSQDHIETIAKKVYLLRFTYRGSKIRAGLTPEEGISPIYEYPASDDWVTACQQVEAVASTTNGSLLVSSDGQTDIAAVSLMPADNVDGFRRDTIELLKQLDAPIYRWPGGNFVSGYEWRDGIGDRDKRPTIPNPAWTGIDTNDVGLHEFMRFCELVDAEPLVVVNTGLGSPEGAAQELEYCNGAVTTPMGLLRKANGSEKPFAVHWWGIGNEMYGNWQLGHIPVAQYTTKHNQTVDRMKAVDPTIKTIAVGETGPWDEAMLPATRKNMTLLSEHIYVQERQDVIEHTRLLPEAIRRKADWHRRFQPTLQQEKVNISMDEWNYWYGPYLYGELGTRYYWKDGMGVATGLHEFFRNTDVFEMAQYAQTVNVIGAIKTTPTSAEFETTGLVLMMYRKYFGTIPVSVEGINPDLGLDIVAALTPDKKTLTIAVVNPFDREMTVPLSLVASTVPNTQVIGIHRSNGWDGGSPLALRTNPASATAYSIANTDPMAYNEPGKPRTLDIKQSPWTDTTRLTIPAQSVTIARISV